MTNETSTKTSPRRYTWLLALPLAAALSVPAVHAFAGAGKPEAGEFGGHFGGGRRMGKLLETAGATDAQKEKIKATWTALRPQLQALRQERMKLHGEMQKALSAPTIDTAQVERLRQQGVQLADKTSAIVSQGMVQSAQVLTPEQRQKVVAEMQQRRGHRRGQ
jgi:protein CpxP